MNSEWIGKKVSLNCGGLGFYQGIIQSIQLDESTLTIRQAYQNGIACKRSSITLSALDIKELKILDDEDDKAKTKETEYTPHPGGSKAPASVVQIKKKPSRTMVAENLKATSRTNLGPSMVSKGHYHGNGPPSPRKEIPENVTRHTPYRREREKARDEECFGSPVSHMMNSQEFDFEKNLALFDKRLVFNEIDQSIANANQPDVIRLVDHNVRKKNLPELKYRNDENVLASVPAEYRQISTGETPVPGEYVTDSGLIIPTITTELRNQLTVHAESGGLSLDKMTELVARAAADLSIQAFGGSHRLAPSNSHQIPVAIILCGPSRAGSYGLATARILASHGVKTVVYMPDIPQYPPYVASEYSLYKLTGQKWTNSTKDLPEDGKGVDIIILALEDYEMYLQERSQPWHRQACQWVNSQNDRTPAILNLDPPPSVPSPVNGVRMSLCAGFLPLYHPDPKNTGKLYLVNLGIPQKVYKDLGITYASPFGAKAVIPLHYK